MVTNKSRLWQIEHIIVRYLSVRSRQPLSSTCLLQLRYHVAVTTRQNAIPWPQTTPPHATRLNVRIVSNRRNALRLVALGIHRPLLPRHGGLTLQVQVLALLLRGALLLGVGLDTVDELVTGARVADVLDADVDALLHVTVVDLLVQDDADSGLGHVVDDAGLAVVDLRSCISMLCCSSLADRSKALCSLRIAKTCRPAHARIHTLNGMPFCTAPLQTTSTISPTLYVFMYVESGM